MSAQLAFDALADPVRRAILTVLAERDECSVKELVDQIDSVGRTGVSNHLRILRHAGLVTERKVGRFRFYSIDRPVPPGMSSRCCRKCFEEPGRCRRGCRSHRCHR